MIELPVKLSVVLLNIETPPRLKLDPASLSNSIIHYSEPDADPCREQSLYSSTLVCHSPSHVDMT